MSPEQAVGHTDLDGRCDLWALATIAFEALTNDLPVAGASVPELINAARSARTIPLKQYRPDLPQSVGAFFEQAFLPDVDARFATAAELTRAFDLALAPERPRDIVLAPETPPPPPASLIPLARPEGSDRTDVNLRRRRRPMFTALWLMALLATGFAGANWRTLVGRVDRLLHIPIALAASESPRVDPPVRPPPAVETAPAPIPSLERLHPLDTVPIERASIVAEPAPVQKTTAKRRPRVTVATSALDVPTPDRGVVASVESTPKTAEISATPNETVSATPECEPPYVVDATTGKKHWKLECM